MPKVSEMIHEIAQNRFLKKEDVGNGVLVTISRIEKMNIAREGEPPDIQYLMYFLEVDKPLVTKTTNLQLCAIATGVDESEQWPGKKIVLYTEPNVSFGNKLVGGIRIRAPRNQPVQPSVQQTIPVQQGFKERVYSERLSTPGTPPFDDEIPF